MCSSFDNILVQSLTGNYYTNMSCDNVCRKVNLCLHAPFSRQTPFKSNKKFEYSQQDEEIDIKCNQILMPPENVRKLFQSPLTASIIPSSLIPIYKFV